MEIEKNGEKTQLRELNEIHLSTNEPLNIYVHTPLIQVQGEASFNRIHVWGSDEIRDMECDLNITGYTEFGIFYSDTYTLAGFFSVEGALRYSQSLLEWNEWKTLPHLVIWTLMLLPVFVTIAVFLKRRL